MTSSLTFAEVVECVLAENQHRVERSLDDLRGCCAQLQGELDDLIDSRKRESLKSSQRRIKKEIDLRQKDLESLSVAISQQESSLGRGWDQLEETMTSDDGSSDHGAEEAEEAEMAITPVADDAPLVSAMTHPLIPLQSKNKPIHWRWMMGMMANPQLAPSPPGRMTY